MTDGTARQLRLAFFITSYLGGPQLARLVRTLRAAEPQAPIVVHHDEHAAPLDPELFANVSGVHVLTPDQPIVWGDMSLEAARWRVFRWILDHLDVDWVSLLSEQDYLVAPTSELRARLSARPLDAIMSGSPVADLDDYLRTECDKRYSYQYASLPQLQLERRLPSRLRAGTARFRALAFEAVSRAQPLVRFYRTPTGMDIPSRVGLRARRTPFSAEFPCWFNDCWFTISRRAMQRVVDYVDTHPDFVRYYERTVIPLESATATIVFNDPQLQVENASLHAIRWSDPVSGRPDVFRVGDLAYLRASGAVFARKFGPDPAILDELDRVVLPQPEEAQ